MPQHWLFACGCAFLPASGDPFAVGLGGTEQAIIHLTTALAAQGHTVHVTGAAPAARTFQGVAYLPPGASPPAAAALAVAVNDATLLPDHPGLPTVWFHNEVELLREWRKGRLPALRARRPAAVFIGTEQARLASRLLPFRARHVIPYGLPPSVLASAPATLPPGPHAIFTSQAYRGLRQVIALWRRRLAPAAPAARLTAYVAAADVPTYAALAADLPQVSILPRIGNAAMLDVLRHARVLVAPGHRSETFCLAAAEAIAMGVPVITLGIGSLKERVVDDRTGYVARTWNSLAARTVDVLQDDALWARLHAGGVATRTGQDWAAVARRWSAMAEAAGAAHAAA